MDKKDWMAANVSTKEPAAWNVFYRLISFIVVYAKAKGFEGQIIWESELIADELLTNIIRYAYPQSAGMIEVKCCYEAINGLTVEIKDCGIPFNPLIYLIPDCTSDIDIDSVQTDGFGIYIARCLLDDISYERKGNMNCLTLRKKRCAL